MKKRELEDCDFTGDAWELMFDVVDNTQFLDKDAQLIYDSLRNRLKVRSFGDYLRRYIYRKAGLTEPFREVPLEEYRLIINCSFSDNHTPASFFNTSSKLSALSKNWLTQQTVRRNVVFLLGFGLNMSVDDVDMFLSKVLREQKINPKDPFEVICWYCYKNGYNFLKFEQLWQIYTDLLPDPFNIENFDDELTVNIRNSMRSINGDKSLIEYLAKLKANGKMSVISVTAKKCFDELYNEARDLIANMYNAYESEEHEIALSGYIKKLLYNERMEDMEKQKRVREFRSRKKVFCREDITESDIEHIICSAIPTDKHGNIVPGRASKLNEQFAGKRFSRQHICDILTGEAQVTRFDLITLNFFLFSQKLDVYSDAKIRYIEFQNSTNKILERCSFGRLYVQNPYECFVLMCILSNDPLGTYADVLEMSYNVLTSE